YTPAGRRTACASHRKIRIRFNQCIVVRKLFIFLNVTYRDEITAAVKSAVAFARMIQIPLNRQLVEIELRRWHKTIWSPNAKCHDLTLQILVESWKLHPDTGVWKSSSATPSATFWPRLMFFAPNTPTPPWRILGGRNSMRTTG